ncbi:NAD(P)(+) transhydrogenase (Re/Si-specific) subunit beta [Suttonella sp. R2A3]|uniref:NAD(P)(+) transhydrogenase (Re/Si-specific) subunit beta n=1 Tax=Suttonella sp. R2A3 TaxID=2908648 RepID=UPI001F1A7650|nr:NAD(P)(+) transhydrogenase (Re/Si-specific) subunit beta [Suttonella sp. R2A3]UJF24031.1 NAD(P)(+) transhydrogenase (Re/Si-specific) subunit beta [Suttonella sp. R2A3]
MMAEYANWLYLIGAVLFILTLRGLSGPKTAVRGNRFGMIGMVVAVITTFFVADGPILWLILPAMIAGAVVGLWRARTVAMTQMPETVALMHSLVGLAAVAIALATVLNSDHSHGTVARIELFIGCFIGAITFSASVFAFGKLAAKNWAKTLAGRKINVIQAALFIAMLVFGIHYFISESLFSFIVMTVLAVAFGWFWIAPIGGGDMPVVVSLLNSFSGWAAAGIGFTLGNSMLIIAGSLVGSSGAILSYIMCRAMNRSLLNVLFGGFASAGASGASDDGANKTYKTGSSEDAAFLMSNSDSVVIVPGYGMAQGRAQNAVKELYEALTEQGVNVRFAIHPVAGRMPGHMNVLLAEADVPYEAIFEMDEINSDMAGTDVVLIIGANDVVNPAAKEDSSSPIYGMPIIEARKARTVMVIKRSMNTGYAGLDNSLFYMDKTMMIFGDAKKMVENMIANIEN